MSRPDASLLRHRDALEVHWPSGTVSHLHFLWLRDNCNCEECRVVQTSEKRFLISDVPADVKASFRLDGGDILIVAAHRVLHGREAFEAAGSRHLQDAYFELDNVRNHLVVLQRKGAHSND